MVQKERFALVWLIALITILGVYFVFASIIRASDTEPRFVVQISGLAAALISLAAVVGVYSLITFARYPDRSISDLDERDRLIEFKASQTAYKVLIAGMIVVGCVMPFNKIGWDIVNAAVFAIAISEVIRSGLILRGYRRGLRV